MLARLDDLDEEFKHEGIELDLIILLYITFQKALSCAGVRGVCD